MIPIEPILDKYEVDYRLDREGNQQVRCPFHEDTHASASVNIDKGLFKCFTCDVAGDAIELLMTQERLTYAEAKSAAEGLAGGADRPIPRGADAGDSFLPRRKGPESRGGGWKSPWSGS